MAFLPAPSSPGPFSLRGAPVVDCPSGAGASSFSRDAERSALPDALRSEDSASRVNGNPRKDEPGLPASVWEKENAQRLRWLALTLVLLGLAWRFSRYLLRFPVWGDEAMLLVNYFNRGYLDLLGPIDNCQVAPLLFHWIELAVVRWLGTDELLLRLVPFLTGLASVALFWRLARLTLPPLAKTIAVGIFAVSIWPVCMGAFTKPYAFDLFFSLALLLSAVTWLRRPSRWTPLAVLAGLAPVAVLASYPSVFIGGAVSLTLLPVLWRGGDRKAMALFALYNLLLVGTFAGHYFLVGLSHLASPVNGSTTAVDMHRYWESGFPPLEPLRFVPWFVLANTGQMAAYPVGSAKGGSILTVFLGLVGVWHCYRHGGRRLLILTAGAFGLAFLAGLLRRYPYGTSCRVAQHLAPFYCLLAGLGAAVLIQRLEYVSSRWKATMVFATLLILVGVCGMMRDFLHPYRDNDAPWARDLVGDLMARSGDDPIVTAPDVKEVAHTLQWQLRRHGSRVVSQPDVNWQRMGQEHSSLWIVAYGLADSEEQQQFQTLLAKSGRLWRCVERTPSILVQRQVDFGFLHCRVYHWVSELPHPPGVVVADR